MRAVSLAEDHRCELPMTQSELADATGITTVHVNRTLQELRRDELITLKGGKLQVLDWPAVEGGRQLRSQIPSPQVDRGCRIAACKPFHPDGVKGACRASTST
jgi:DNA-binding transcriptional regulator YhcF (GntR family)